MLWSTLVFTIQSYRNITVGDRVADTHKMCTLQHVWCMATAKYTNWPTSGFHIWCIISCYMCGHPYLSYISLCSYTHTNMHLAFKEGNLDFIPTCDLTKSMYTWLYLSVFVNPCCCKFDVLQINTISHKSVAVRLCSNTN